MQNISLRIPGTHVYTEFYRDGNSLTRLDPTSTKFVIRQQSGYTGKRPKGKPYEMHAYTLNCQEMTYFRDGTYKYPQNNFTYAITGKGPYLNQFVGGAEYPASMADTSALYNDALDKLTSKVRGDLDLSIDLAEVGKTRRMLNIQGKVIDYTKTFIRRWGPVKVLSNAWLEYTYGVKPLLQTLYGVADENLRVVINRSSRFSARSSEMRSIPSLGIWTKDGLEYIPVVSGRIKKSVTLGVDVRTDQFDPSRWSSLNPVSIAWELLPYSFVVDWFVNVGGYLRNMETYLLNSNKFRSGYKTVLTAGSVGYRRVLTGGPTATSDGFLDIWTGNFVGVDINRTILSTYPAPVLPSLNAKLGSSRLLSGAALLAQLLGRR